MLARADLGRAAILLSAHYKALSRVADRRGADRATPAFPGQDLRGPGDVELIMAALDDLAAGCGPTFDDWHRRMFVDAEFSGNGLDYHDARNSFLPHVLERKVGIPISIAVVGLELAKRIGLPMWGVGMPGHFLLGTPTNPRIRSVPDVPDVPDVLDVQATSFIDPFNSGAVMDFEGCVAMHNAMFGDRQELNAAMLAPVSTELILIRMTNNLKSIYARDRYFDGLTAVLRLRSCLPDLSLIEGCELVRLLEATGSWSEARGVLDQLLGLFYDPEAQAILDSELNRLSARLN